MLKIRIDNTVVQHSPSEKCVVTSVRFENSWLYYPPTVFFYISIVKKIQIKLWCPLIIYNRPSGPKSTRYKYLKLKPPHWTTYQLQALFGHRYTWRFYGNNAQGVCYTGTITTIYIPTYTSLFIHTAAAGPFDNGQCKPFVPIFVFTLHTSLK